MVIVRRAIIEHWTESSTMSTDERDQELGDVQEGMCMHANGPRFTFAYFHSCQRV